ncbi:hypothetical protein K439DRAFT_375731 [Ramaria rubella]|nr:hypothetical protein K439DRAFT_375731 [Ramaria rubella]
MSSISSFFEVDPSLDKEEYHFKHQNHDSFTFFPSLSTLQNLQKKYKYRKCCKSRNFKLASNIFSFPTFPSFLFHSSVDSNLTIPRSHRDMAMDSLLPRFFDFLSSSKRPVDLDPNGFKCFIKQATRFFVRDGKLWRSHHAGFHQIIILSSGECLSLMIQAHDQLGHKGIFSTRRHLMDRFWWLGINRDLVWFVKTCHECQLCSTQHVHILPTVTVPAPLFQGIHIDTMFMPTSAGFSYIIQGRCSLTSYLELKILAQETGAAVGKFIFNDILCRWGAVEEMVTDNGVPIVAGLD